MKISGENSSWIDHMGRPGADNHQSRHTEELVRLVRTLDVLGYSHGRIAANLRVPRGTVWDIATCRTWRNPVEAR